MKKKRILRWPINKEDHAYMQLRGKENKIRSKFNKNELWMKEKLKTTGLTWSRQSRWGYRIFDFWNHMNGIAIEVDGPEHNKAYDSYRDKANLETSGILVIRVRNKNEYDAKKALDAIATTLCWNARREMFSLKTISSVAKVCKHCKANR